MLATNPMQQAEQSVIRTVTIVDLDDIIAIEQVAQVTPWTLTIFKDSLEAGCYGLVVELEGVIIAYSMFSLAIDESTLLTIAVDPDHQNQGYGKKLLIQSQVLAKDVGAKLMFLEARVSNKAATQLYLKLGFEQLAIRKDYYRTTDNSREDALIMRCRL